MILLDSDVVIEATRPEGVALRARLLASSPGVSDVTLVETLGYHSLADHERQALLAFFGIIRRHTVSTEVVDQAIRIRQARKVALGDALIAATAIVHGLPLLTRNVRDFRQIVGLTLLDPPAG